MFNRIVVSVLGLFWTVSACAEWTFIHTSSDRSQNIYLDFSRIKMLDASKNEVEYWVKYLIKNDKEKDNLKLGDYSLALYRVGCNDEVYSIRSSAKFRQNGSLISQLNYNVSQIRPLIPNTTVDFTAEMVCHVLPQQQKVDRLEQLAQRIALGEY